MADIVNPVTINPSTAIDATTDNANTNTIPGESIGNALENNNFKSKEAQQNAVRKPPIM
ncbi:hypothetical protein INT46_001706 [Mucor plumbeus]|uniref:Uncharacterized protein n=1 Tax=Mucor plumbeus TaxID=97098 RepID=A0A8H7UZL1_9FUNG|nr:hypothetical protein INT46_001706 [Mucor plumbeus]